MTIYTEAEELVYQSLVEYGADMKVYHNRDLYIDNFTGDISSLEVYTTVKGIVLPYPKILKANEIIQKGDLKLVMDARHGKPQIGQNAIPYEGGAVYRFIDIEEYNPTGVEPIFYEVTVRSYAIAAGLDTVYQRLRDLPNNSIVIDISEEFTPEFRVVGQEHYTNLTTTLVTNRLASMGPISFTNYGGWPTKPWPETWARKWLYETFTPALSTEMRLKLQLTTINTWTQPSQETLWILSTHELGGEGDIGYNHGEHMEYFESNAERTMLDADGIAQSYWTRDAWGVRPDGAFFTANPNNEYHMQVACALRSTIWAAYNVEGKWEIQWDYTGT